MKEAERRFISSALSEDTADKLCVSLNSILPCDAQFHSEELSSEIKIAVPLKLWRITVTGHDALATMFCEGYFAALGEIE